MSKDKSKVLYSSSSTVSAPGVLMYDINTKNTMLYLNTGSGNLNATGAENISPRSLILSPNGKYLYTEYGTDVLGGGSILSYDDPTKTVTDNIAEIGTANGWVDNNTFIVNSPLSDITNSVYGISKISVPSGQIKSILTSPQTGLVSYSLEDIKDGVIFYSRLEVKNMSDWTDPYQKNVTTTYWKMDVIGQNNIQISKSDIPVNNDISIIQKNLPSQYSQYSVINMSYNDNNSNWVLFDLYKSPAVQDLNDSGASPDLIGIMDLKNPSTSFYMIGEGDYPEW